MSDHEEPSSGVRALIDRVRSEGVTAGEEEGHRIIEDARRRAAELLESARRSADEASARAKAQAEVEREAGRAALEKAARDTVLAVEEELTERFAARLRRLVETQLDDPEMLRRLILELVGSERPAGDEPAEVILPPRAIQIDELRDEGPELGRDPTDRLVVSIARAELREGVRVRTDEALTPGLLIRLEDGGVEIEVSAESVAELLGQHLLPRFRGLLEGVFR